MNGGVRELRRRTGGAGDPVDPIDRHAFGPMDAVELADDVGRHLMESLAFLARVARRELAHLDSQPAGSVEASTLENWRVFVERCLELRASVRPGADPTSTAVSTRSRPRRTIP